MNTVINHKTNHIFEYTKIIRIIDKKVFFIGRENNNILWLCKKDYSLIKPLKEVRDLEKRFRKFIIGVDND